MRVSFLNIDRPIILDDSAAYNTAPKLARDHDLSELRRILYVGASAGVSLLSGPFTFGVNRTEYTNPPQLGRFWAFDEKDYVMFLGRQAACR